MQHGARERLRVQLAGKVQTVHEFGVAPLMERGRGLIVFQALENGTVDDHLVVLQVSERRNLNL